MSSFGGAKVNECEAPTKVRGGKQDGESDRKREEKARPGVWCTRGREGQA